MYMLKSFQKHKAFLHFTMCSKPWNKIHSEYMGIIPLFASKAKVKKYLKNIDFSPSDYIAMREKKMEFPPNFSSLCIWGHAQTMWTVFWTFLTPLPPWWTVLLNKLY